MASRNAFSSSATDPVPAAPLLVAVAWPNASPEASTTKHIFSNNLIELFLLCCSSVSRPIKVTNFRPWLSQTQEPNLVAEIRVSISHHSSRVVHRYVDVPGRESISLSFPIFVEIPADVWNLIGLFLGQ